MGRRLAVAATLAATATTVVLVRSRRPRASRGAADGRPPRSGWLAVTILGDPDAVLPGGRVPAPLARLGGGVEVEARVAPGDRGTELRARFRRDADGAGGGSDTDTARRGRLRAALRETKQLVEVGEVLRVDPVPHGRRSATPTGALVDVTTARSNEWGLL